MCNCFDNFLKLQCSCALSSSGQVFGRCNYETSVYEPGVLSYTYCQTLLTTDIGEKP
ncbi:hypothetical protein SLEP1_g34972 [Rubroshorea leprosula]|uniref:Uncharacterized protein n=1 Tax=Rubroshorea leprosula TaxID=152421 RepID=A0AAV5KLP1_9ROSI|nr:hypothetical protein SLEP1_g34972 [Rubroshorea leprosula]